MSVQRAKAILEVHVMLVRDSQICLLRRQNTGYQDGMFSLPAGHVEEHESAEAAACRETFEETAVDVRPEDLEFVHLMHRYAGTSRVGVYFQALRWQGEIRNNEPAKCDAIGWFDLKRLPENIPDYILCALRGSIEGRRYSSWS